MTTKQLISRLQRKYGRRMGLNMEQMRQIVLGLVDDVGNDLADGVDVKLEGLGVLKVNFTPQPKWICGRKNPQAGQLYTNVTFRDGIGLKRKSMKKHVG